MVTKKTENFLARITQALHHNGLASDELEQNVLQLAARLNLKVSVFATPTSIFFSFGDLGDDRTMLLRVVPGEICLGQLSDLMQLQSEVVAGEISLEAAEVRLDEVLKGRILYPPLVTAGVSAWAGAGCTAFLGGGFNEWIVTLLIGIVLGALHLLAVYFQRFGKLVVVLSAFFSALLAFLIGQCQVFQPLSVEIVTLGGIIVLIPGLTLTIAISELATQNLAAGTARLSGALVLLMTLAFGVVLGSEVGQKITSTLPGVAPQNSDPWLWWLTFFTTPVAFAVLFQAKVRDFFWICLVAFTGVTVAKITGQFLTPQVSGAAGALTLGLLGTGYTWLTGRPSATVVVPGLTLLVPGSVGFRSIQMLLRDDVQHAVRGAFDMFLVSCSLVAGLLLAYALFPAPDRKYDWVRSKQKSQTSNSIEKVDPKKISRDASDQN